MHLTFYGAAREVTGSMHLLTTGSDRILLDCGLFQGKRKESTAKNKMLPIAPSLLSNIVLSHAHLDHTGRLPLVCKNGFTGRIIATRATADACKFLLPDSAHIQESDAAYLNYKRVRSLLYEMMKPSRAKELTNREKRKIKDLLKKGGPRLNAEAIAEYIQTKEALSAAISETFERGGTMIIPAFAFGRTQTLLYLIHELYRENKVPRAPVYVDSPLQ